MKRKTFIKFLMAHGIGRNDANTYAIQMSVYSSYKEIYEFCCKVLECNNTNELIIQGSKKQSSEVLYFCQQKTKRDTTFLGIIF